MGKRKKRELHTRRDRWIESYKVFVKLDSSGKGMGGGLLEVLRSNP